MKAIPKDIMLLIFICSFFQIIKNKTPSFPNPVKPFVSVLSPETMEKYKGPVQPKKDFEPKTFVTEDSPKDNEKKLSEISFSVKCMFVDDFNLYDISGLGTNSLKEGEDNFQILTNLNTQEKERIYYNFCYDLRSVSKCKSETYEKKQILSVREETKEDNNTICTPLANSINKGNKWSKWQDKKDNKTILYIELNNKNPNHTMLYELKCNSSVNKFFDESKSYHMQKMSDGKYQSLLYFETKHACPKYDFYVIWKFVNDYVGFFALALIAFGAFNCLLGHKLAKFTAFLLALFGVVVLVLFFSQYILPSGCDQWIIWVILVIGIILGCTAGYFVFKYHEKILTFLVGGLGGFLLGEFLFNLFGNAINGNATLIHILFIVVSIVACIILAYFLKSFIIILATSFIGSYALIRGISLFAGHFPSEYTVIDLKERGETAQLKKILTWRVYVYLAFIVITCGLSIYVQFKLKKKNKDKEEEETPDENLEQLKDKN